MPSKIDGAIEAVGALGRYQWVQISFASYVYMASSFHFLAIVFHAITPPHRCKLDGWANDTYQPFSDIHNTSINQWTLDSCKTSEGVAANSTRECNSHVFDASSYSGEALNMKFDLVCSREDIGTAVKVIFTTGLVVGALVVGVIGDRFGRRIAIVGSTITGGILGVVAAFSVHIWMFAALRFLIAGCFVGAVLIAHIITMEVVGPSRRTYAIAYRCFFWPIGTMLTSVFAYYFKDWNWFQLAISIPALVGGLAMAIFLKETPHYLVTKGKHEEAEKLFKHIAKVNGRKLPKDLMDQLKEDEESAASEKLVSIIRAPVLLKRTAIFLYLWFIAGLGFYGLNFNVTNLLGDVYINNVISGAAELPTVPLALLAQKLGRKAPIMAALFIGSLSLLASAVMNIYLDAGKYGYAMILVYMIGKAGIATVFVFDYFWSSEVYPTTLRSSLVGLSSLFARIGSILSPVIADMSKNVDTVFGAGLGSLIFGITMFIGGVLTIFLPETNKYRMPETIAEANIFRTDKDESHSRDIDDSNGYSSTADFFHTSDSVTKL